jgi:hypothetical protein
LPLSSSTILFKDTDQYNGIEEINKEGEVELDAEESSEEENLSDITF